VARFRSRAYAQALEALIQKFQPHIVQVESPYLTPYIEPLTLPAVYRLHNIEWQIWQRHAQERGFPLRAYLKLQAERIRRYEEQILPKYAGLLPISPKEAEWAYQAGYRGPMEIFPFGINLAQYHAPPLGEGSPRIGFIGGLDWLPNQEGIVWFLEEVWPAFRRYVPTAQLSIAGRNCPKWLYKYADTQTQIIGEVADAQAFFHAHEIFIAPLFSGSGIRIKLIEAFATGRAIVATSIAAESLTYEAGTHLLLADTPTAFVEALLLLYRDVAFRQKMGKAARMLAETHYDRQALLPKLTAFYHRVLHG
jgi:glycosyltransferase involved in cell wall biosynthesis